MHCVRRAASRAACTAGNSRATRIPMMAITTNNSTSVKPRRELHLRFMKRLHCFRSKNISSSAVSFEQDNVTSHAVKRNANHNMSFAHHSRSKLIASRRSALPSQASRRPACNCQQRQRRRRRATIPELSQRLMNQTLAPGLACQVPCPIAPARRRRNRLVKCRSRPCHLRICSWISLPPRT